MYSVKFFANVDNFPPPNNNENNNSNDDNNNNNNNNNNNVNLGADLSSKVQCVFELARKMKLTRCKETEYEEVWVKV